MLVDCFRLFPYMKRLHVYRVFADLGGLLALYTPLNPCTSFLTDCAEPNQ